MNEPLVEDMFGKIRLSNDDVLIKDDKYVVSLKNVHKTYLLGVEGVAALRGVSFSVQKGEYICIYGMSGGGKTTMLNIIGTIDKPSKGELSISNNIINEDTEDKLLSYLRLKKIGFVFQTFNLISSFTAFENVELPLILAGELSKKERKARVEELLELVGMKERANHKPSQLSGGEQQRVTIARALANRPDVLLLDEPTGDLDSYNTAVIMKLLTKLNREDNITLIMVTHDVNLKNLSDKVVWMRDGKIGKIEENSDEKKEESMQRLDDMLELKRIVVEKDINVITEIRDPLDYPQVKFQQELMQTNK